jgi:5'-deoxynucleotidase YfbR-like HD superfamily hydrolase
VHDFPERYAGDVWTFNISDADRETKEAAEHIAKERLLEELPPYLASLLKRYEEQIEPEARFVRFIDKLLPSIINAVATEAVTFKEDYNVQSIEQLNANREARTAKFQAMFPEFQFVHLVRDLLSVTSATHIFKR